MGLAFHFSRPSWGCFPAYLPEENLPFLHTKDAGQITYFGMAPRKLIALL